MQYISKLKLIMYPFKLDYNVCDSIRIRFLIECDLYRFLEKIQNFKNTFFSKYTGSHADCYWKNLKKNFS